MEIVYLIAGIVVGIVIGRLSKPQADTAGLERVNLEYKKEIDKTRDEIKRLVAERADINARYDELKKAREVMPLEFESLSNKVLESQIKNATEKQTKTLDDFMKPFREQMVLMQKQATENKTSFEEQIKYVKDWHKEAIELKDALRGKKKLQGNWGEIQIERLFEILGWEKGVQYSVQEHASGGRDIPDYIVNMADGRRFVVDAKMSLNSYMDYFAADEGVEKNAKWREFVDATKKHITELGAKNYQDAIDNKFDYVCMFMPLEHAYIELMNRNDDIYRFAYENGVTIATPSLLLPLLRSIDTIFKIEKQNKNVVKIVDMTKKLYEKYVGFTEDYKTIGTNLERLQKAFDDGNKKLTSGSGNLSGWFEKIRKQGGISVNKTIALEHDALEDEENE